MQQVTERKTCRLCGSDKLESVLHLGELAMSDFLDTPDSPVTTAPLELVECKECTLVQLRHTAPMEKMYRNYWYRSKISPVICNDLREIATVAVKLANAGDGDIFLDIGCNDGSMFPAVPQGIICVGCEPAQNLKDDYEKHCKYSIPDYWSAEAYAKLGIPKAKVITAIGCFYDMEDPNQFVGDVKKCLAEDGVFVAQLMTLLPMLKKNDVGNIVHEHLEYYTYQSLVRLYEQNGLEIFKVEQNDINGGSYRLFAKHFKKGSRKVKEAIDLPRFVERIEKNKKQTVDFIRKQVAKGRKVYGFGASTKASTILQWYGLTNQDIVGIADKNIEKIGKYTVGTKIKIVSEDEARKDADYFFILPYAFAKHFIKNEAEWHRAGGLFILSTPKFRVI